MEKKLSLNEVKQSDKMGIVVGIMVLFTALTAVLGYEELSIGNVMVFAFFCVMSCMAKDLKELCNSLAEEE